MIWRQRFRSYSNEYLTKEAQSFSRWSFRLQIHQSPRSYTQIDLITRSDNSDYESHQKSQQRLKNTTQHQMRRTKRNSNIFFVTDTFISDSSSAQIEKAKSMEFRNCCGEDLTTIAAESKSTNNLTRRANSEKRREKRLSLTACHTPAPSLTPVRRES